MVLALTDLAPQELEQLVTEYLKSLPILHWHWLDDAREALWAGLLSRAQRGEIEFRGVKHGASEPSGIHSGLLRGSVPDFLTDRLEASGSVYHAIGVFTVGDPAAATSTPASTSSSATSETLAAGQPRSKKRKPTGADFRESDSSLVIEMQRMIQAGEARNPTDAARALARTAAGAGTEKSKVTRLISRYTKTFSPVQR